MYHFFPGGELHNAFSVEFGKHIFQKYGHIVRFNGFLGRKPVVVLFDPESISMVLRSENVMPVRPGFQTLTYYRKCKNKNNQPMGLIADIGEPWRKFRTVINPVMLQPKIIKLYHDKLDEVAMDMVARLRFLRGKNGMIQRPFDLEMNLWSLESASLVALGRRLNCFDLNLPSDSPERRLIDLVHEVFRVADELDFRPSLWRYFPTRAFKRAMKLYEEQDNATRYFIDKTIKELKVRGGSKTESEKGVLEKLLDINKDMAVIMASDMITAGVDTTSNTMLAILYLLAVNQEKQDILREELMSGGKRSYLKACIKESMRIMPVSAANARETSKEYNILGYHIPKGMQVTFMHQVMAQMEEHYPRPQEFIPERWTVGKEDPLHYGHANPFTYNPFGFGVRSCAGRRIALLELEIFLARIIQNFKVEWLGPPGIVVKSTTLNYVKGPFNFIFKDI
ncbi:cytochrome P450 CYP12A2-like [Ostrinia nubilalis]|uniref:cytochrome P450 CYP12A2-like n=1 Tax=Ostrinia nubilalis TaxID=29057 RepID=UPI0030824B08